MPAYISHTIMAREVYKRINNKYVNEEYMITFSLGGDLTKYSKCRRDSHNKLLDEFIYNMCMYMRRKNLTYDGECLGVLYGHICHYIMDTRVHPLVRKIDKCCEKNKHNHRSRSRREQGRTCRPSAGQACVPRSPCLCRIPSGRYGTELLPT